MKQDNTLSMSHQLSLSVGSLNVLLNLFVVFLVAIGAEIAHYGLYKSTQLQLKRRGTAPIVTEADDIFSGIKNRVVTARKSRNIINLAFVLVAASLVIGEICSEIGVHASQRCEPQVIKTSGLCAEPYHHMVSDSRMIAHAYHTRVAEWDNYELQSSPIYEGFRKNFNGRESFNHPPHGDTPRVVVAGCAVSKPTKIEPNEVSLSIKQSPNVWGVVVSQVVGPNGSEPLQGFGDVTSNGRSVSAFIVVPIPDDSAHAKARLLEYHSKSHLQRMRQEIANTTRDWNVEIRNEEYMVSYNVWCNEFAHPNERFASALQVFRSVQLEDSASTVQNVSIEGRIHSTIPPMNGSDAVRAAIVLTLMNEKSCDGETFEYTECGVYDWKFIAPLMVLFGSLVIFAVYNSLMVMIEQANNPIPYNSSTWSALALQHIADKKRIEMEKGESCEDLSISRNRSTSSRGFYELVDGEDGPRVVLRLKRVENADDVSQSDTVMTWKDSTRQAES